MGYRCVRVIGSSRQAERQPGHTSTEGEDIHKDRAPTRNKSSRNTEKNKEEGYIGPVYTKGRRRYFPAVWPQNPVFITENDYF